MAATNRKQSFKAYGCAFYGAQTTASSRVGRYYEVLCLSGSIPVGCYLVEQIIVFLTFIVRVIINREPYTFRGQPKRFLRAAKS